MNEPFWAVIPAGGKGLRAHLPIPKQFQEIGGVPVLERTVRKVLGVPGIAGVVVSLPAGMRETSPKDVVSESRRRLLSLTSARAPVFVVEGGATRLESVWNGLEAVPEGAKWIAVHDACRPFFTNDLFCAVVAAAQDGGAAICAVSPSDTIKETRGSIVAKTLNRDSLAAVQTPQVFCADIIREAYRVAMRDGVPATDDSSLVERLGYPVTLVPGERGNIKVTYPEDFAVAETMAVQGSGWPSPRESGRDGADAGVSPAQPSMGMQVTGLGLDVHPLAAGRQCVIGGVAIPFEKGLAGHSDADVLCHAVMDAVLGALGKGDIGVWFPNSDPEYEGASSVDLMAWMWGALKSEAAIVNVDATVMAEAPRIMPHAARMRENIAAALGTTPDRVSVKATTAERLGSLGRGEGVAAFAVATLAKVGLEQERRSLG